MTLDLPLWIQLIMAGGLGGVIRWWTMQSDWRAGVGHVLAGAIAGTYLSGLVFALLRPLVDMSLIQPADAQLLGAHIAGVVGINIYTIPTDIVGGWRLAKTLPLSDPKEPQP